jgi:beta-glucosidase
MSKKRIGDVDRGLAPAWPESRAAPPFRALVLLVVVFLAAACAPPIGEREAFPAGFVWGVSSDGTAILGSAADLSEPHGLIPASRAGIRADIALLKTMGVTSYRFNLDWDLLLDESGSVDEAGLAYYQFLVDELARAGMSAVVTLYQGDLPPKLEEEGAWQSPATARRLVGLSRVVMESLGDGVSTWITVDNPFEDRMLRPARISREVAAASEEAQAADTPLSRAPPFVQARRARKRPGALDLPEADLLDGLKEMHQVLMAHAGMVEAFRSLGSPGRIGIALGISPVYAGTAGEGDVEAVRMIDGLYNRWLLDGLYRGAYPEEVLEAFDLSFAREDMAFIRGQGTDFLGISYFGPVLAAPDTTRSVGARVLANPDRDRAFRGQVLPDGMFNALTFVSREYGHPAILVTANGVGYGRLDELREGGRVRDELRLRFMRRHIVQVQRAIVDGARVEAYYAWTGFDGPDPARREGLIFVDFETRERLYKDSARLYSGVVRSNSISRLPF